MHDLRGREVQLRRGAGLPAVPVSVDTLSRCGTFAAAISHVPTGMAGSKRESITICKGKKRKVAGGGEGEGPAEASGPTASVVAGMAMGVEALVKMADTLARVAAMAVGLGQVEEI